jgi:hypothetical protein
MNDGGQIHIRPRPVKLDCCDKTAFASAAFGIVIVDHQVILCPGAHGCGHLQNHLIFGAIYILEAKASRTALRQRISAGGGVLGDGASSPYNPILSSHIARFPHRQKSPRSLQSSLTFSPALP